MSAGRGTRRGHTRGRKKSVVGAATKPHSRRPKWARVHREEEVLSWRVRPLRAGTRTAALPEQPARRLSFLKTPHRAVDATDNVNSTGRHSANHVHASRLEDTSPSTSRDTSCVTFASSVSTSSLHGMTSSQAQSNANAMDISAVDGLRVNGAVENITETTSPEFPSALQGCQKQQLRSNMTEPAASLSEKNDALQLSSAFFEAYNVFLEDDPLVEREWLSYFAESHWPTSCEELWKWPPVTRCLKPIESTDTAVLQIPKASASNLEALLASPDSNPHAWSRLVQEAHELVQYASHRTWIRKELRAASPNPKAEALSATFAQAKHNHRRGIVCEACLMRNRMRTQQSPAEELNDTEHDVAGREADPGSPLENGSGLQMSDRMVDKRDRIRSGAGLTRSVFFDVISLPESIRTQSSSAKPDGSHRSLKTERGETGERSCDVCMSDEQSKANRLWRCSGCGTVVHQVCYGIVDEAEQSRQALDFKWLCRACEQTYAHASSRRAASSLRKSIRCSLCGAATGALKPATNGSWAHLFCALCAPDTTLGDIRTMEPVIGLDEIPAHRRHLRCVICHKSTGCGGVLRCHWANCNTSFHASCGRRAGYLFLISERESLRKMLKHTDLWKQVDESALEKRGPFVAVCFCREHSRKAFQRISTPTSWPGATEPSPDSAPEQTFLDIAPPVIGSEFNLPPRKIRELHRRNELRPFLRIVRMRIMSGLEVLERAKQRFKHIHSNGFSCQACLCRTASRKLYDALCRFNRIAGSFESRRGMPSAGAVGIASAQRLSAIMGEVEEILAHQTAYILTEKRDATNLPAIVEDQRRSGPDKTEEQAFASTDVLNWLSSRVSWEDLNRLQNHGSIEAMGRSRLVDVGPSGTISTSPQLCFRLILDCSGVAIEGAYGLLKPSDQAGHDTPSPEARNLVLLWYHIVPADPSLAEFGTESGHSTQSMQSPLAMLLRSRWEELTRISLETGEYREMLTKQAQTDVADRIQLARLEQEQEACMRRLSEISAMRSLHSHTDIVTHHGRQMAAQHAVRPPMMYRHGGLARLESCPPQSMAEVEADLALQLLERERSVMHPVIATESTTSWPCPDAAALVDTRMLIAMNARCDICGGGDCDQAGNDIILCDRCGIGVHQRCYGVAEIPAGDWFCDTCQLLARLESDTFMNA
jgi:hypothetical protein